MNFFELLSIGDGDIEILSPITEKRILEIGEYLELSSKKRIIDFGCGKGELLRLWAENFGITGVGVELREDVCKAATDKIKSAGLSKKISIVQSKTTEFNFPKGGFDIAVCIASSFTWGGFRESLSGMRRSIRANGKIVIGEPFWHNRNIDFKHIEKEPFFTESELLEISHECKYDFEHVFRALIDDIDRYESELWRGYLKWIEANPNHPELQQVINYLHTTQKEYFEFDRDNLGWAVYVLNPMKYKTEKKKAVTLNVLTTT